MKLPFHIYDVFTDRRFGGNPLAIVSDADDLSTEQMQTIAREFNLSETIFIMKPSDPANTARVRIFFPTAEIPFAGHPTVGCAIFLAEGKHKPGCSFETEIRLEEEAGLVPVKVTRIGSVPRAMFTAPVIPFVPEVRQPDAGEAAQAAGLSAADIGFGRHVPRLLQGGPRFLLVPLKSSEALKRARPIEPHWSALVERLGTNGGYFYAQCGGGARAAFGARMFAPTGGIPEDPASGSATAILARQLADFEDIADGTHRWDLEQGHEMGRPSELRLEADIAKGRLAAVRVAGQAVQIMEGVLEV